MTGAGIAATASAKATDVWVSAPAFSTTPSTVKPSVDFIQQQAFVVALKVQQFVAFKLRLQFGKKIFKRAAAVYFRLAAAQQVQVRPVYNQEFHGAKIRLILEKYGGIKTQLP